MAELVKNYDVQSDGSISLVARQETEHGVSDIELDVPPGWC